MHLAAPRESSGSREVCTAAAPTKKRGEGEGRAAVQDPAARRGRDGRGRFRRRAEQSRREEAAAAANDAVAC